MSNPINETWTNVVAQYYKKRNFPNCLGSIDGKRIRLKWPANTDSMYYNYKNYVSLNLQAVADSNLKFIVVDIGAYG